MSDQAQPIIRDASALFARLADLSIDDRIDAINTLRLALHEHSPLRHHPVDCVLWVKAEQVIENDYNPNFMPPPEEALLHTSIKSSGYTQPIVAWPQEDGTDTVVDGAHRRRVGVRYDDVRESTHGYLPITLIRSDMTNEAQRIVATVEHNRARGSHLIDEMQGLVQKLVMLDMSDAWIMKHLGMDVDELLRLKQLTGLAALFQDAEFSRAWIADEDEYRDYREQGTVDE